MNPLLPLVVLSIAPFTSSIQKQEPKPARYVRIELPGVDRILSLAEVEVFSEGELITHGRAVQQSSVASSGVPERAIDGNTLGVYTDGSVTHTETEHSPWWEVDLGDEFLLDRVVVWNRTDCCEDRLKAFSVQLYDKRHKLIWERNYIPRPRYRSEIVPFTEAPSVKYGPSPEELSKLGPRINLAVDEGVQFLLRQQMWDGSFQQYSDQYPAGSTGLALYTLIQSGVPRTHPSITRAANYLLDNPPRQTYELGTVLMGLCALDNPEHEPVIEQVLEELIAIQGARSANGTRNGLYSYPEHSDLADLSNTQYAALGLRAAHKTGMKIPDRVWLGLIEGVMQFQEVPREVETSSLTMSDDGGKSYMAGFPYRINGVPTASMTTAGLGILGICEEGWVRMPAKLHRELRESKELGTNWLTYNFSVTTNPGGGGGRLLYYLYGLERVGALLGIESFGINNWYWEGAKKLVADQGDGGGWSSGNESDTCFAILFLSRATASPSTGVEADRGTPEGTWIAEETDAPVHWRVTGGEKATIFISGFSEDALEEFAFGTGSSRGLRVLQVEYLVNGDVVATITEEKSRRWAGQRYATRYSFNKRGSYKCEVRVKLQDPEISEEVVEIMGAPLVIEIEKSDTLALKEYLPDSRANLLRNSAMTVRSSSAHSEGQAGDLAVDGLLGTGWVAAKEDLEPSLTVELRRAQRGRRLMLSQLNVKESSRNGYDRATRVRVVINDKINLTFEVDVPQDDEQKLVLELKKTVAMRQFEVTILDRVTGARSPGQVGISEIQWHAR